MDTRGLSQMCGARLLFDPPAPGSWNMAADEALLHQAAESGAVTVRFYAWTPATVSLGYFQSWSHRWQHGASGECPAVRRATGGGAIVHDRELTYSIVCPAPAARRGAVQWLLEAFHQSLIETLACWQIHAKLCARPREHDTAFLCFQRRAPGDVILSDWKIAGSAQRRYRHAVLQHGSILLGQSPAAPELLGIRELSGVELDNRQLIAEWTPRLAQRLQRPFVPGRWTATEIQTAGHWAQEKYSQPAWNEKK